MKIIFVAWHSKILFYNSERIKRVNYIMPPNPADLKLSANLWKMMSFIAHLNGQ